MLIKARVIFLCLFFAILSSVCLANEVLDLKCGKKLILPEGFEKLDYKSDMGAKLYFLTINNETQPENIAIIEHPTSIDIKKTENSQELLAMTEALLLKEFKSKGYKIVSSEKRFNRNGYPIIFITLDLTSNNRTINQKVTAIFMEESMLMVCFSCLGGDLPKHANVCSMLERQLYGF